MSKVKLYQILLKKDTKYKVLILDHPLNESGQKALKNMESQGWEAIQGCFPYDADEPVGEQPIELDFTRIAANMTEKKEQKTDPKKLAWKMIAGCLLFKEILETTVTLSDAWAIASPYIIPLLESATPLLTPEEFWFYGVIEALQKPKSEQLQLVNSQFEVIQGQEEHFIHRLRLTSESDKASISEAYDNLISELNKAYPDVPLRGL